MNTDKKFLTYGLFVFVILIGVYALSTSVSEALTTPSSGSSELSATIRTELLKDPRAQNLPPAQLNAMVNALTAQAQAQGVTAQQIAYQPGVSQYAASASASSGCADISSPLCPLGQALGFDNPNKSVAVGLWVTSAILLGVIWLMNRNPHIRESHGLSGPVETGTP